MSPLSNPYISNRIGNPAPLPPSKKPPKREITGKQAIAIFFIMGIVIWLTVELVQFLR